MQLEAHNKLLRTLSPLLYLLLLTYGSLYPAHHWDSSLGGLAEFYAVTWPVCVTTTDVVLNLLIYLPIGFFSVRALPKKPWAGLALAILASTAVSGALEFSQTYLPQRISSPLDLLLNILGATLGALLTGYLPNLSSKFLPPNSALHRYANNLRPLTYPRLSIATLATCYSVASLYSASLDFAELNISWMPFRLQLQRPELMLQLLAPCAFGLLLGYFLTAIQQPRAKTITLTGAAVMAALTALEIFRQWIPGQAPDMTRVVVALASWLLATLWLTSASTTKITEQWITARFAKLLLAIAVTAISLGMATFIAFQLLPTDRCRDSYTYDLPALNLLPYPALEDFKYEHPRLPVPTRMELETIQRLNPQYWAQQQDNAARGSLFSHILLAQHQTNQRTLNALYSALSNLTFTRLDVRHLQNMALAYDWYYPHWSNEQRTLLLAKLNRGCAEQIEVIRKKLQLSPYNAMLYNGHLQALMMSAVAIHGDGSNSICMRFTADYWRNRVVPVWQQIMGENGGWHEGGRYFRTGIGQAAYQLPAIWRAATGEDFFQSLPGIEGLIEFAMLRHSPGYGSHSATTGNALTANFFDLPALAIEFNHRAGYNYSQRDQRPLPLSYPWGPLPQPHLHDSTGASNVATEALFDGIGALFARSSWENDATWLTFRAGNNYWSQPRLNQGSFSIFRAGPLIVDTKASHSSKNANGTSTPRGQGDAFNLVAITGGKSEPGRQFSAGQRLVGSGHGRPAPLDYPHWLQQQDHYRTVGQVVSGNDSQMIWMNADLTPAYKPAIDAVARDSSQTRVDYYHRSFAYLKASQLIVVYDKVTATSTDMQQSLQLHSVYKPQINDLSFEIEAPLQHEYQLAGGRLYGRVLLPQAGTLEANLLTVPSLATKDSARWRIDITAPEQQQTQEFLVVMRAGALKNTQGLPEIQLQRREHSLEITIAGDNAATLIIPRSIAPLSIEHAGQALAVGKKANTP